VSPAEILVLILGLALIAGELWFFLGPRPGDAKPARKPSSVQEIRIVVKDGYDPSTVFVEAGRPVRLLFYRDETAPCSERVVFGTLGIDVALPAFETTAVGFTPAEPGDYAFRCAKDVLKGRVVAQVGGSSARANLGKGHVKHG
jgi:plastocyanin domain-containing protein